RAKVMEADRNTDLALLRVRASNLVPVKWDASGELSLGSILATPGHGTKPLAIGVLSLNTHQVESDGVLGIMMARTDRGPRVTEVVDGSAAEKAGVEIGDQIVAMNSRPVDSLDMVISSVSQMLPGEVVRLRVVRDEQERELVATLGRRSDLDVDNGDFQSYLGGRLSFRRSGFGSVLQHDTFLLPEYCGGPIVDLQGNVVGVNIARAERIASYALPATVVKAWIDQAMQKVQTSVVASK
ncbi:MAG: PDZ domain-containing protein, partial [Planctomycetales bacterium]|nr:PDZ domain-containing protein [Planctomycetales bacterium]